MDDSKHITVRIWTFLLRRGGQWSAAEIAREMKVGSHTVASNLCSMHKSGTVRKFEKEPGQTRKRFGITRECKVPRGVQMQVVVDCMGNAE